jgi:hypothetical protein
VITSTFPKSLFVIGVAAALLVFPSLSQAEPFCKIVNVPSGHCAGVAGRSFNNAAPIVQWPDQNQADVLWEQIPAGGAYKFRNLRSGKYLAVAHGGKVNPAYIVQWHDFGQADILWQPVAQPGGTFKLRNIATGKYLAVEAGSRNHGARLLLWHDFGQADILWRLKRLP